MSTPNRRLISNIPLIVHILLPILLLWRVVFLGEAFVPADLLHDLAPWRQAESVAVPWNPLMWDGIGQFYPWRLFASNTIHAGYLPLWNPHQFCGTPFVANSQSAIFYPPNLLFAALPVKTAFGVSVLLHLFLTGKFMYLFCRRALSLQRGPALLGSTAWQLCTWQVSWLALPTFLCVSTWIPAALLTVHDFATASDSRKRLSAAVMLGVTLGLMLLAGHLQVCLYGFLLIAAYALPRLGPRVFRHTPNPGETKLDRPSPTLAGPILLAIAIALLLGLGQVLPSLELSHFSHRAGVKPSWEAYQAYISLAVPPYHLAALILPGFFGNPTAGNYWGATNYAENAGYVGLLSLILAIAGTWATWRKNTHTRFFAAAAVIALLLACGTPLNAILYFGIPGFAQTGSPGRILVLWSLCASVLAAVGAQAVLERASSRLKFALSASAAIVVIILAIAIRALTAAYSQKSMPDLFSEILAVEPNLWRLPAVVLIAGMLVIWRYRGGKMSAGWTSASLVGIVALDMLATGIGYNHSVPQNDVYPATPAIAYLQQHANLDRVMVTNRNWSIVPANPPRAVLPPNGATVYGLYDTQGYDSLFPGQYMQFAAQVNGDGRSPAPNENGNMVFTRGLASEAARALAPRYVLSYGDLADPNLREVQRDGFAVLYENTRAKPRFEIDGNAADAVEPAPTRLSVSVPQTSGKAATLLIRDQWAPGWKAMIDGKPTPILESPLIFRTLKWTPSATGTAIVDLRYAPSSIFIGIYCLILGWALVAGTMVYRLSRR